MRYFFLFMLLAFSVLKAQNVRYFIQVTNPDNGLLVNTVTNAGGNITIERSLDFPEQNLNALAVTIDPVSFNQVRNALIAQYGPANFILVPDAISRPDEGSGDTPGAPILGTVSTTNAALDDLVPARPVLSPPLGPLTGKVIIEVIGTGIDYGHSDFTDIVFEPAYSVMPNGSGGYLPGDVDFHNHESRLTGCIAGKDHGLLTALGTAADVSLRSVLCYDKPDPGPPASASAWTSDCIAGISEVTFNNEFRLLEPYLKNHPSIICYAHSVQPTGSAEVRVGSLDAALDYAWERGVFTAISAGNRPIAAALTSPAGAGEWIVYISGGGLTERRYWPPFGAASYDLPGTVGFTNLNLGANFHLKAGAHNVAASPMPWYVSPSLGSALNTSNPVGFGPSMNDGVDLYAPGESIPVPATRTQTPPDAGHPTIEVDGITYSVERGYQTGNGTSYSAAYTAALAARIFQLRPWASNAQVRDAILAARVSGSIDSMSVPDLVTLPAMSLTYTDWIERYANVASFGYFLGGLDGHLADPDGDGVSNLVEYHCGMDPRYKDAQHAPQVVFDEENLTVTVSMQLAAYLPSPAVIDWEFQSSNDLDTWTGEGKGTVTTMVEKVTNGDGTDIMGEFTFTLSELKEFYRVAIYTIP